MQCLAFKTHILILNNRSLGCKNRLFIYITLDIIALTICWPYDTHSSVKIWTRLRANCLQQFSAQLNIVLRAYQINLTRKQFFKVTRWDGNQVPYVQEPNQNIIYSLFSRRLLLFATGRNYLHKTFKPNVSFGVVPPNSCVYLNVYFQYCIIFIKWDIAKPFKKIIYYSHY